MAAKSRFRVMSITEQSKEKDQLCIRLSTGINPKSLGKQIETSKRIELEFLCPTDADAYTQAFLLRRQLHFSGDLRAVGDIKPDQLVQLERAGFTSAVLRDDIDITFAERQMKFLRTWFAADTKAEHISW